MGLYNFQPRFVRKILRGEKTHTIRAARVHQDKPGNTMHLYTGLRRKGARLLGRFRCSAVQEILIYRQEGQRANIWIDGQRLSVDESELFARRDGFTSFADMMRFWSGRLPFRGFIFHWTRAERAARRRGGAR
jgi:hypothetical protein